MTDLRPIPKPLALRVQDLLVALQVIRDLIEAVRAGHTCHMAPIYGQLRSLLTDAASGNTPLLSAVAEGVAYPLNVFSMASLDDDADWPTGIDQPAIHISPGAPSLHRTFTGQREMTLAEYLERKMVRWEAYTFSVRTVIQDFANTAGGAHYSKDLKQQVGWFQSLRVNEQPAVINGLLQVAELTLALGTDIVRHVSGVTLLLDAVFQDAPPEAEAVIFDSIYPDSAMRMTLSLQADRRLRTSLVGLDGSTLVGISPGAVPLPSRGQVSVRFEVEADMSTRLELILNGKSECVAKSEAPIFLVVNQDSNIYWNRSVEREDAGMHLCIAETMLLGPESAALDRAQVLAYTMSPAERENHESCVEYPPGAWGLSPEGESDLTNHGDVTRQRISKFV